MSEKALIERLGAFIGFERALRAADSRDALDFLVCNEIGRLVRSDTVLALHRRGRDGVARVASVAGVSGFEADAPLVTLVERVVADAVDGDTADGEQGGNGATLSAERRAALEALGLSALLHVRLGDEGDLVLLRRGAPFAAHERRIAAQAADAIAHAARALRRDARGRGARGAGRAAPGTGRPPALPRRLRALAIGLGCAALACLPVRQSVMAEAEIIAARPEMVVAGLDGVVAELLVAPNERVRAGQTLVRFDGTELEHARERVEAELALARDRLREARQSTLGRAARGALLAELEAAIALKRLDLRFTEERLDELELRAASDGVALYSREQDWLGRAVRTGDPIMEIAVDAERRFEAWVAVGDAIELAAGDEAKFFPDAFPLDAMRGTVRSTSFFARRTPTDTLAYRVVADLDAPDATSDASDARLGMKGSVRLYGERVSLGYYLLRRPLATTRRVLGV